MHRDMQILIVASDSETVATVATEIVTRLAANVTIVDSIQEARSLVESDAFDVVLTESQLSDGSGLALVRTNSTPTVVIEGHARSETIAKAFRGGAADVISVPVDGDHLAKTIERLVDRYRTQKSKAGRNARLRRLSKGLIKDRRELRRRVDLICRDLVHAYQRLAEKVVATTASDDRDWKRRDPSSFDEAV